MATKKAAGQEVVEAKKPGTSLVSLKERLKSYATKVVETEKAPAGSFISVKGGQLQFGGNPVAGNKLDCIIAGFLFENAFYEDDYDPDDPRSPVCFAFGESEEDMKPHPNSSSPQCETCKDCPHNEWGSADKGRGKACKNIRRLGLFPGSNLDPEVLRKVDGAILKSPVTSVKAWAKYARDLSMTLELPPFAVVTAISAVPDPKTQFKLVFENKAIIEDGAALEVIMSREQEVKEMLEVPYEPNEEKEEKPKKGSRASAKAKKY